MRNIKRYMENIRKYMENIRKYMANIRKYMENISKAKVTYEIISVDEKTNPDILGKAAVMLAKIIIEATDNCYNLGFLCADPIMVNGRWTIGPIRADGKGTFQNNLKKYFKGSWIKSEKLENPMTKLASFCKKHDIRIEAFYEEVELGGWFAGKGHAFVYPSEENEFFDVTTSFIEKEFTSDVICSITGFSKIELMEDYGLPPSMMFNKEDYEVIKSIIRGSKDKKEAIDMINAAFGGEGQNEIRDLAIYVTNILSKKIEPFHYAHSDKLQFLERKRIEERKINMENNIMIKPQLNWKNKKEVASLLNIPEDTDPLVLKAFEQLCQMGDLNPVNNDAYLLWYQKKNGERRYTKIIGIGGYQKIARRSDPGYVERIIYYDNEEKAHDVWIKPPEVPPAAVRCIITTSNGGVADVSVSYTDRVAINPYSGEIQGEWKTQPAWMLAKCARAAALKNAFPENLSDTYEKAEMYKIKLAEAAEAPARAVKVEEISTIKQLEKEAISNTTPIAPQTAPQTDTPLSQERVDKFISYLASKGVSNTTIEKIKDQPFITEVQAKKILSQVA
ncbi:MAG: recombinase RecT [Endomicrobium sp.]|nr:recombinase RecT [Endomicrobium sp.]